MGLGLLAEEIFGDGELLGYVVLVGCELGKDFLKLVLVYFYLEYGIHVECGILLNFRICLKFVFLIYETISLFISRSLINLQPIFDDF